MRQSGQKPLGNPACFKVSLAVWRDLVPAPSEIASIEWTEPDFMITASLSNKITSAGQKQDFQLAQKARHLVGRVLNAQKLLRQQMHWYFGKIGVDAIQLD